MALASSARYATPLLEPERLHGRIDKQTGQGRTRQDRTGQDRTGGCRPRYCPFSSLKSARTTPSFLKKKGAQLARPIWLHTIHGCGSLDPLRSPIADAHRRSQILIADRMCCSPSQLDNGSGSSRLASLGDGRYSSPSRPITASACAYVIVHT